MEVAGGRYFLRARENDTPRHFGKLIGATLKDMLRANKLDDNLKFKKGTKVFLPTAAAVDYKRRADEAAAQAAAKAVAKAKAAEAAAAEAVAAEAAAARAAAARAAAAEVTQAEAAQAPAAEVAEEVEEVGEAKEAGRGGKDVEVDPCWFATSLSVRRPSGAGGGGNHGSREDVPGSGAADVVSLASVVQRLQAKDATLQAELTLTLPLTLTLTLTPTLTLTLTP